MKFLGERKNIGFFLVTCIFLALVYFRWLLPFPHVANDLHVTFPESLLAQVSIPFTWGSEGAVGMGEFSVFSIWNWPIRLLFGFLGNLGISHNVLNQYFALGLGIVFSVWGIRLILREYRVGYSASFLAGLFYLINTYILLLIDGGQLAIALAYFFFPITYFALKKGVGGGITEKVISSLAIFLIGVFDIRFVYLIAILIGTEFVMGLVFINYSKIFSYFYRWFSAGIIVTLIFILLNFYWIFPGVFSKGPSLPVGYIRASQVETLSFAKIGHALLLLQPHWFKNVFGKVTELRLEFALIPVLVFLAPVLKRKRKIIGVWLLVALVGVFLVKGANPPFPGVYPWLFTNVPGFSLFRDPTKFFFLVALSYSVLIGVTVEELSKKFKWKIALVPLVIALYFVWLVRPVWFGQMTGTFAAPIYQDEYAALAEKLEKDKDFGRVFWIPTKAPLGFSSPTHPSVEASRLVQKRPFAIGTVGTYEIFNFLREAPFMGELFDIAAIKYVVYPFPDTRREELKQDNVDYYHAFLDQLSNLDWIDSKISDSPVAVLKTKKTEGHLFLAENTWFVVGSDRIYWDLMEVSEFSLSNNALIFVEENVELGNGLNQNPRPQIILYDKEERDLAASFIGREDFIFPANDLGFDPDESGWWKREGTDLVKWRDFLQQKYGIDNLDFDYGGGWAVSEADSSELTIQSEKLKKGRVVLARVMTSSRGGKVEFHQGDVTIGEINTKIGDPDAVEVNLTGYGEIEDQVFEYNKANFAWYEVGLLADSSQSMEVKTEGEINVVNAITVVPKGEWKRINESIRQYKIVDWYELTDQQKVSLFVSYGNEVELSYQRISPTHYKVRVEGVNEPVTLAFSETYDRLWELRGQESFPLYGLINGFTVWEDGEYNVYFSAQQFILPGLYISVLTIIIVSVLLLHPRKKS